jgi:hypothetical protein
VGSQVGWRTDLSVKAFGELKRLFVKEPLLVHFDFEKLRYVHVDSFGFAIAAVLSQPNNKGELLTVSYFSRKLTDQERSWMIFALELLEIVEACKEWRIWLMVTSEPVWMFSDHSNLLYFKTAKYLSPKQACWALFIDNFNMLIYHVSGKKNPADGPSCHEDFVGKFTTLPEAQAILDCLVQPAEVDELQTNSPATFHGIHIYAIL